MAGQLSTATGSEDLLTSLVFERVSYLSDDALSAFWTALLPGNVALFGRIERIEFWPRFELEGRLVEPDVLLETENALIVVEAKRWDQADLQYAAQAVQELLAVAAGEPRADELPLVLLLVGGRQDTSPESTSAFEAVVQEQLVGERLFAEATIRAVKWTDMLEAFGVVAHLHSGYQRMRDDVEAGLKFHGLLREPDLRLHELHSANLGVEAFELAFAVPQNACSTASADRQPVRAHPPISALPRLNINYESFSFHK
ncbi:hypothetical protein [Burkholderia contaminans]|uniref:hypothetical protein n=1 Tax=Burkholderia contaminans TaxID=488447 RepID=UPI000F56D748|nr:hypothetical protein [Burkholderia contaminans]RQS87472.1 hypothetical protein DF035_38575 [Burkholderia contaminans]